MPGLPGLWLDGAGLILHGVAAARLVGAAVAQQVDPDHPVLILDVRNAAGQVIYRPPPQPDQAVIDPRVRLG